jgi:hypothetical protein
MYHINLSMKEEDKGDLRNSSYTLCSKYKYTVSLPQYLWQRDETKRSLRNKPQKGANT